MKRQDLPLNPIPVIELCDVWGINFMSPFLTSYRMKYIHVAVEYVSKWVEAIALSIQDLAHVRPLIVMVDLTSAISCSKGY